MYIYLEVYSILYEKIVLTFLILLLIILLFLMKDKFISHCQLYKSDSLNADLNQAINITKCIYIVNNNSK